MELRQAPQFIIGLRAASGYGDSTRKTRVNNAPAIGHKGFSRSPENFNNCRLGDTREPLGAPAARGNIPVLHVANWRPRSVRRIAVALPQCYAVVVLWPVW